MNKTRQFCALVKFQLASKPDVILLPLAFAVPYFFPRLFSSVHNGNNTLESLLSEQRFLFFGFLGALLLAPETMMSATIKGLLVNGAEFLLTRAVDRRILLRSRSALFYFLILIIPVITFLCALKNKGRQNDEFRISHQYIQVLGQMTGSSAASTYNHQKSVTYTIPETITIPNGNILIKSWGLWMLVCTALGAQALVSLLYPLKYRRFIFWGIFVVGAFFPMSMIWDHTGNTENVLTRETVFFAFIAHQPLFWLATIAALVLGQLWCEHRFSRFEQ